MKIRTIRLSILFMTITMSIAAYGCNAEDQAKDSEDSNMNDPKVLEGKDTAQTGDTLNSNSYIDTTTHTPKSTPQ